ncbi:MAG: leucine-rich repeat domain-containing protein [Lachnospiraceae bacterium]|nr:leucine-rich repeat domain-containing protein [Lachnospiraceae bacterium]
MFSLKFIKPIVVLALISVCCACSKDDDPKSSGGSSNGGSNLSVKINSDGLTKGDAVFSMIDGTTFFLDYVKYKIVDSHLEIIGYDDVELPPAPRLYASVTIDNAEYKTRIIDEEAFRESKITSIVLPSTVTEIRFRAFSDCGSLASVVLPESLIYIGRSAFIHCKPLISIVIPELVSYIGADAFDTGEFYSKPGLLKEVIFKGMIPPAIENGAFSYRKLDDDALSLPDAYVPEKSLDAYTERCGYHFNYIKPIK